MDMTAATTSDAGVIGEGYHEPAEKEREHEQRAPNPRRITHPPLSSSFRGRRLRRQRDANEENKREQQQQRRQTTESQFLPQQLMHHKESSQDRRVSWNVATDWDVQSSYTGSSLKSSQNSMYHILEMLNDDELDDGDGGNGKAADDIVENALLLATLPKTKKREALRDVFKSEGEEFERSLESLCIVSLDASSSSAPPREAGHEGESTAGEDECAGSQPGVPPAVDGSCDDGKGGRGTAKGWYDAEKKTMVWCARK